MEPTDTKDGTEFSTEVGRKEKRILKGRHENKRSIWSGLGMFGMVGWSVAVPALMGAAFGRWLDKKYTQSFSWTLTFLVTGLFAGCLIAWHWVAKEYKDMHNDNKDDE